MENEPSTRDDEPSTRDNAHTEATRLLCAGVYLSGTFRGLVIDELVGQAHRPVAPSLGADVLPVLAHALHARRQEVRTALLLLAVWVGFLASDTIMTWDLWGDHGVDLATALDSMSPLDSTPLQDVWSPGGPFFLLPWSLSYGVVAMVTWFARGISGRGEDPAPLLKVTLPGSLTWVQTRLAWMVKLVALVIAAMYWFAAFTHITRTPYPVIFPLLIATVVWWYQQRQEQTLRLRLAKQTFATTAPPPLPARYRRIGRAIRREQDASLTLYDMHSPFIGAGTARKPWSVVLELKPAADPKAEDAPGVPGPQGLRSPKPLTARQVIKMIEPRLYDLRTSAAAESKDRLRDLEVEEFVFLPYGVGRDEPLSTEPDQPAESVYEDGQVARHLAASAGEGGEARRHFLRLRVGAWDEQVVVSLLVRVHTQGGMLVLEVVPHVLGPITEEFRRVDAIVASEPAGPLRDGIRAGVDSPSVSVGLFLAALRTVSSWATLQAGLDGVAAPGPPAVSLRELVSTGELSLLQEMDVTRYIRTLQDRIGEGVRDALQKNGYRTDRLEQNITHINSGVYIGEMSGGAVATGTHGSAAHIERTTT